jgi:hypothetical protein
VNAAIVADRLSPTIQTPFFMRPSSGPRYTGPCT